MMRFLPSLPTHRRIAVGLALAGVLSVAGALQVGALEGESFHVSQDETGGGHYGPLLTSDPSLAALGTSFITPDDCSLMPSCMVIPFTVEVPPGLEEADDYTVNVAVGWGGAETDIDVAVWDDGGQAREEAEAEGEDPPEDPPDTLQSDSASSANPEVVKLFKPDYVDYQLVVINFAGPPVEFDVLAEMFVNEFVPAFELLAPPPTQPERESAAISATTTTTTTTSTTAPPSTTVPTLPVIEPDSDDDFTDFEEADFEEELSPELTQEDLDELAAAVAEIEAREASSPSSAALLLGLVVAPLLFASAAGAWMWRRSPGAIDFG